MDERDIVDILKKQRLDHARPWEAISTELIRPPGSFCRSPASEAGGGNTGKRFSTFF